MVRRRLTVEELEQKNKFLEEQLSFYKVIADNSYDWEMLLSPQGKYVYVSPSCRKITGYTSEEFIQNSDLFNDIVFKDDILKVKHHVERKLQREEIENHLEFRIITKEGSLKWISHLCQEAFDEDNNFIGYRSSNRDITRQKEEEENFRFFFNSTDDLYFILDMNGNIVDVNEIVLERLGYTREELKGINVLLVHPEDRREEAGEIVKRMIIGEEASCPIPIQTKSGELISVETRVKMGRWNGKDVIFGVTQDISELKLSEERFYRAFNLSPAPMLLTSLDDNRIAQVNQRFVDLSGYTKQEILGRTTEELNLYKNPEDREKVLAILKTYGQIKDYAITFVTKNKKLKYTLVTSEIILVQHQRLLLSIINDITDQQEAEKALVESQKMLDMFFKQSLDGFFFMMLDEPIEWNDKIDKDKALEYAFGHHRFTRVNDAMLQQYGFSENQLLGLTPNDFFIHNIEQGKKAWHSLFDEGKLHVERNEFKIDGTPIVIEGDSVCLYDELDRITGIFGIQRDVTDKIEAQKQLIESQQKLDLFFKQSLDGFFFMMLDSPVDWNDNTNKDEVLDYVFSHQRITRVNKAMLQQYGYSENEFIGLCPNDFFEHDIEHGKKIWRDFFDQGKLHIESDERRVDGTQMWVEGDYICMYDDMGRITGHFGIQRDVTESVKSKKQLEESNIHLKEAQRIGRIGNWVNDVTSGEVIWSDEIYRIFGYEPNEMEPSTIFAKHIHPKDADEYWQKLRAEFENSEHEPPQPFGFRIICKKGDVKYCIVTVEFDRNSEGEKIRAFGTIQDISEQKKIELVLKELNATKDKLFSIIAHDLKALFNTILGFSNLLVAESKKDSRNEKIQKFSQLIYGASRQTFNLLENLLQWSNAQTGVLKYEPDWFEIKPMIDNVCILIKGMAEHKKIIIKNSIESDVFIFGDKNMLSTVLRNLLSNAIKYSNRNGEVSVAIHKSDTEVRFLVTDCGIGILSEDLDKLFKVDENVSKPGTDKEKGTGLGLILCKDFVDRHNGGIYVISTPGKGSEFSFYIPQDLK